jgi:hypothetical protein
MVTMGILSIQEKFMLILAPMALTYTHLIRNGALPVDGTRKAPKPVGATLTF